MSVVTDFSRSIDFLLENGGDLLKYRLHHDILHDLTPDEDTAWLGRIMAESDYQLLLTHVHPTGYVGKGAHSWDKFKDSYLDDGEAAARFLEALRIPRDNPVVVNFVKALRSDEVLEVEFSYYNPEKARFRDRSIGLNSGSSLGILLYTMQALLGYGDDDEVKPFVDCSYRAFTSLLGISSVDEITDFNPNLKRKYNYPTITPDTYFPCQYHLETLARTTTWRTPESIRTLAEAINHHADVVKDCKGFAVKLNGRQVGPGWAFMSPFQPVLPHSQAPNQRRTLTNLARCVGDRADVVKQSAEILAEVMAEDGVFRVEFESAYQKKGFKSNLRLGHPYAEIGLEGNYRKDTAIWCDLTFWAVEFFHYIEENKETHI